MKLSKLYCSNKDYLKSTVEFKDGINFILSAGDKTEGHSAGKSKFVNLIKYLLFKDGKNTLKNLLKNKLKAPNELTYFLEVEHEFEHKDKKYNYLTIARTLQSRNSTYLLYANDSLRYSTTDLLKDKSLSINGAKEELYNSLNIETNGSSEYKLKHFIEYFIKEQREYNQKEFFRIPDYSRGKDTTYKPMLASLMGFDGNMFSEKIRVEDDIKKLPDNMEKQDLEEDIESAKKEIEATEEKMENFDFYELENQINKDLVDKLEREISELNQRKLSLSREVDYITNIELKDSPVDIKELKIFFKEIEVDFQEDIKNNYENILAFNQNITKERKEVFAKNKVEFSSEINKINDELQELNKRRVKGMSVLEAKKTFDKLTKLNSELAETKTRYELKKKKLEDIVNSKQERIDLTSNLSNCRLKIDELLDAKNRPDIFKSLQSNINKYSKMLYGDQCYISPNMNKEYNFEPKFSDPKSSKIEGNTWSKMASFIFSISLILAYKEFSKPFINFVIMDSIFDGDNREFQKGFHEILKESEQLGIQIILTSVEDELKTEELKENAKINLILDLRDGLLFNKEF